VLEDFSWSSISTGWCKLNFVRESLVFLAGVAVIVAPYALYAGEVYCKIHKLEAPHMESFLIAAIGGITTIVYFAFKKKEKGGNDDAP
jgi:hypothetical protein